MSKRVITVLLLAFYYPAAISAGEFGNTAIGERLSWKPTLCQKPAKLYFLITDIDSLNAAVEEYNQHLHSVRGYRTCISQEAQRDAEAVTKAISSGLEQENDKIHLEMESARLEIESARRLSQ